MGDEGEQKSAESGNQAGAPAAAAGKEQKRPFPSFKLPSMPSMKVPDVNMKMPDLKMPDLKMPDIKMPEMPSVFGGKSKGAEAPAASSKSPSRSGPAAPAPAASAPVPQVANVGSRVMVKGLSSAAHYNGKYGIVSEIIEKDGEERLAVVLEGDGRKLSVKRGNALVVKSRPAAAGTNPMTMALNSMLKPKLAATGGNNLYEELGVSPTASEREIKHAYYRYSAFEMCSWQEEFGAGREAAGSAGRRCALCLARACTHTYALTGVYYVYM